MAAIGGEKTMSVVIANGQSLSSEFDIEGFGIHGILMPAAWTAANITFECSNVSGGTFYDLFDSGGSEVSLTASAQKALSLLAADYRALQGFRFIKIRSGTEGTPVNQAAERTLELYLRAR